jgi:hypothetical protein
MGGDWHADDERESGGGKKAFHVSGSFCQMGGTAYQLSWPDADAAVWIAQRCNGDGSDQLAIACQSSDFRRHLNEAVKLGRPATRGPKDEISPKRGKTKAA